MNNINEYGLEIKIIEASTLYEYNIGVRNRYESKRSIFSTSLLLDFLVDNGLRNNGESTRDIFSLLSIHDQQPISLNPVSILQIIPRTYIASI